MKSELDSYFLLTNKVLSSILDTRLLQVGRLDIRSKNKIIEKPLTWVSSIVQKVAQYERG